MEDDPETQVEASSVGEAPADERNSSQKSDFEDEEGEDASGDDDAEDEEGEEAETKKGNVGGQALVGSISHILRTLFRDLYQKPALPPSPEPPPTPAADPSRPGTAPGMRPESDAALPDGSEAFAGEEGVGEGEGGHEGEGESAVAEDHDGSEAQAAPEEAVPAEKSPAEADEGPGEGAEANEGAENEAGGAENDGVEAGAEEGAAAAAAPEAPLAEKALAAPPPPPQLTPLQASAVRAMEAVDRRLIAQRRDASRTLEMLASARQAAEAADHAEENALKKQGILVNAHVPVGPSHLSSTLAAARSAMEDLEAQRLQEEEEQKAALGKQEEAAAGKGNTPGSAANSQSDQQVEDESYPSVVPELVSARALMEANWKDYLYKSGNLAKPPPKPIGRSSRHGSDDDEEGRHNNNNGDSPDEDGNGGGGVVDDGLGYLKMTGSLSKRKELLLTQSYGPHGALYKPEKTANASKKSPEAEMDSLLRAEIDADLSANAGFVTTTAAAGAASASPREPQKKPKKKQKEVHGEQHDLDTKVALY